MNVERFFVLIALIPAVMLFLKYFEKDVDLSDPKFHFLFGWFFYGFAVPIDYVLGFKIIQPWEIVDYNQEKYFYGMLFAMLMFYTAYVGFALINRGDSPSQTITPPSRHIIPLTLPFVLLVGVIVLYLAANMNDIMTMSRMERNTQLTGTGYRLFTVLQTVITVLGCIYILYNKNIKKVHALTFVFMIWGLAQGDRSNMVIPAFAWLVRVRPTIKSRTFFIMAASGIFVLFIWKALYNIAIAYALGKNVDIYSIFKTFSLSIIDPVGPFNLTAWVITDWGINDLYVGYTVFILPWLRALPRFLFDFNAATLSEQFLHRFLPHVAEAGGGRAFGVVAEFYLNFFFIGPFIFGLMWGWICRVIKKNGSLILMLIFLICNFRIIRSDVASVFKGYIIIFGGITLLWFLLSIFIQYSSGRMEHAKNPEDL